MEPWAGPINLQVFKSVVIYRIAVSNLKLCAFRRLVVVSGFVLQSFLFSSVRSNNV